ncbi:MAG: 16S rRNA (cytosine(1402)-N(4))-methyltransferase RsmH [Bacteroidales bacterium]|nr:16S rRNA (cytosine(1402)-N(4))-methyltransferase RsmH [Candidatus Equimonas faecalis]
MEKCPTYHIPVLLDASVSSLLTKPDGLYADMTFGGGGHSREILSRLSGSGHLYSFDQDADAEQVAAQDFQGQDRFTFVRSNFRYLRNWMRYYGVVDSEGRGGLDGVLADLGVSSHHFDTEERGFSYRFDAPLDMRMNGRAGRTAADIVNQAGEDDLARILLLYGEVKQARALARQIVRQRQQAPILTTAQLRDIVEPQGSTSAGRPGRSRGLLPQVFQALRMEVNHEMEALEAMLEASIACLKPGGRLAVITYHSLEDRMVKNIMRSGNVEGRIQQDFYGNRLSPIRPLSNKVITPGPEEQQQNPRSRSAKLRIAEIL